MTGSAEDGQEDKHDDERPLWASVLLGVADGLVVTVAIFSGPIVLSQLGDILVDMLFTDLSHFPWSRVSWDLYAVVVVGAWRAWSLAHRLTPTTVEGGDPVEY